MRIRRWAQMPFSADTNAYGSMPMCVKRPNTSNTLLAWTVVSTRWPVRADCTAISAVSRSRISPTMILSGSWRRIERRPFANDSPFFSLTGICRMPGSWYSTGSSIVMIFSRPLWISVSAAYKVVVLPEPVGPVTSSMPYASCASMRSVASDGASKPSASSVSEP